MKARRNIQVILRDQARTEYEELMRIVEEQKRKGRTNSDEMRLLKSIDKKVALLKYNPVYGQSVPKALIPKFLDVDNLFRVELVNYWRMLYTLKTNEVEIINFVLYIIDHPTYDKLFGYKDK